MNNALGFSLRFYDQEIEEKYQGFINNLTLRSNQLVLLASALISLAMSLEFLILWQKTIFVILFLCLSAYTLTAFFLIKKLPNYAEIFKTLHGLIVIWTFGESLLINFETYISKSDFSPFIVFYSAGTSIIYTINNFFWIFLLKVNMVIFTWFRFNQYSSINVYIASICSLLMTLFFYQKEKNLRLFFQEGITQQKFFSGYKKFLDKGLPIGLIVIQKQKESLKASEEIMITFQNQTFIQKFPIFNQNFEYFLSQFEITGNQISKINKHFGRRRKRIFTKISNDFEDQIIEIYNLKDLLLLCISEQNDDLDDVNQNPLTLDFVYKNGEINYEISVTECIWKQEKSFYVSFMDLSNKYKMIKLQELDKIKDNILATVSHDLKNPINSICNFLQIIYDNIITKKMIDQEVIEHVQICQSNVQLMQSQINDLQDFSMLKNFRFSLSIEQFNLQNLVKTTEQLFQFQCNQKMIKLISEINLVNQDLVNDPNRIKQVFNNLLGNAIKFSKQNGNIFIKITDDIQQMKFMYSQLRNQMKEVKSKLGSQSRTTLNFQNLVQISIEDNGIGIPLENQKQLFKMYSSFQRDGINKKGVGLGLVICKSLIGELGPVKFVYLDSQPEIFTKFLFFIYKNRLQTSSKQSDSINEDVDSEYIDSFSSPNQKMSFFQPKKSRFLRPNIIKAIIIDDDPFICKTTKLLLQQISNIEVTIEDSGQKGFDSIVKSLKDKNYYDLILIDQNMPGLDGVQCIEKLKKIENFKKARTQSKYRIIMISADADQQFKNECSKKGIDCFLTKPFTKNQLQEILREI